MVEQGLQQLVAEPAGEQLVEQPGQAGPGGRADGVLGGGDARAGRGGCAGQVLRDMGISSRPGRPMRPRERTLGDAGDGRTPGTPGLWRAVRGPPVDSSWRRGVSSHQISQRARSGRRPAGRSRSARRPAAGTARAAPRPSRRPPGRGPRRRRARRGPARRPAVRRRRPPAHRSGGPGSWPVRARPARGRRPARTRPAPGRHRARSRAATDAERSAAGPGSARADQLDAAPGAAPPRSAGPNSDTTCGRSRRTGFALAAYPGGSARPIDDPRADGDRDAATGPAAAADEHRAAQLRRERAPQQRWRSASPVGRRRRRGAATAPDGAATRPDGQGDAPAPARRRDPAITRAGPTSRAIASIHHSPAKPKPRPPARQASPTGWPSRKPHGSPPEPDPIASASSGRAATRRAVARADASSPSTIRRVAPAPRRSCGDPVDRVGQPVAGALGDLPGGADVGEVAGARRSRATARNAAGTSAPIRNASATGAQRGPVVGGPVEAVARRPAGRELGRPAARRSPAPGRAASAAPVAGGVRRPTGARPAAPRRRTAATHQRLPGQAATSDQRATHRRRQPAAPAAPGRRRGDHGPPRAGRPAARPRAQHADGDDDHAAVRAATSRPAPGPGPRRPGGVDLQRRQHRRPGRRRALGTATWLSRDDRRAHGSGGARRRPPSASWLCAAARSRPGCQGQRLDPGGHVDARSWRGRCRSRPRGRCSSRRAGRPPRRRAPRRRPAGRAASAAPAAPGCAGSISPAPSMLAGRASSADHVRMVGPQLGGVLDHDQPLVAGRPAPSSAASSVVLPEPVPPLTRNASRATTIARAARTRRVDRAGLDQLVEREAPVPRHPQRDHRARPRDRRQHGVEAGAVGAAGGRRTASRRRADDRRARRAAGRAGVRPASSGNRTSVSSSPAPRSR